MASFLLHILTALLIFTFGVRVAKKYNVGQKYFVKLDWSPHMPNWCENAHPSYDIPPKKKLFSYGSQKSNEKKEKKKKVKAKEAKT
ncbi:jg8032 [Pararge aegeria aegeria]|uniref:Jg8032 protein n=1 Tax=Pararge aegeria aegeria TaxID=348720 RepID=A0A8S4RH52_9NEOP|nr:jg8032 [Pararge aegeria aegeria]